MEGVGAVLEHFLGIATSDGGSLDAKILPEHGVRLPAAEKLNGIAVNPSTQESGGASRSEGAGTDQRWLDPRGGFNFLGGVTESIGDELGLDFIPFLALAVVVSMDRVGRFGVVFLEMEDDAA